MKGNNTYVTALSLRWQDQGLRLWDAMLLPCRTAMYHYELFYPVVYIDLENNTAVSSGLCSGASLMTRRGN